MSEIMQQAATILNDKMGDQGFDGTAKFVFTGLGALIVDAAGARVADEDAEVTLTADPDVFKAILDGEQNATAAFMTGKLSVDGDMGLAMKLAGILA